MAIVKLCCKPDGSPKMSNEDKFIFMKEGVYLSLNIDECKQFCALLDDLISDEGAGIFPEEERYYG